MSKKIVIKYGGVALNDADFVEIDQVRQQGLQPIIIHGGGKEVSELSLKLGIQPVFKNGLRVTDAATMDIAQMVLLGRVNTRLVAALRRRSLKAIGVSGLAQGSSLQSDLGYVGKIDRFDGASLEMLCEQGYIPVIAPIAIGEDAEIYNVNGDSFAAAVASAVQADWLFLMTDIDGVYLDPAKKESRFSHLSVDLAKSLAVKDGMIPKLKAAVDAIESGVSSVLIGKSLGAHTVISANQSEDFKNLVKTEYAHIFNTYIRYPIVLERGLGSKVWDSEGKEYLDLLGGIAVVPLGHCHPAVVSAIHEQTQKLMHTSNLFYSKPMLELAQCLTELGDFQKVFFCNSGTEANEGAIKLARKYQWRKGHKNKFKIVSASHSFHGRTFGALAATAKVELQEGFGPLPEGFAVAEWNNIDSLEKTIDENTAAFIVEPVQGEGGIHPASQAFLMAARRLCDQFGALLIFDEIQCGLGRLGTFYAYQSFGVTPDVVTLAKGLANGLPIGAICASETAAQAFQPGDHGTTFGANLVCAAAALATMKVLLTEDCCTKARDAGLTLMNALRSLQKLFPDLIQEVRGMGLMIGLEINGDANRILSLCLQRGLIINVTAKNVIRLLPSYLISPEEITQALAILQTCLTEISLGEQGKP